MADKSWLGALSGSAAEAKQRANEDARQRAEEARRQGSIILSQNDILTGNWDAHKVLFTTLGGKARVITADDLVAFRENIKTAQSRLKKGITAQQVINLSLSDDRSRAIQQIRMAVPVSSSNGKVRFITNAGPDSDKTRHHVMVEFMNYGAEAASGLTDPRKAAMRLRKGPLKIECDCEHFRYVYRYIATIGGFNAGRAETGFPKIKNPKLQGIACKHLLRVMKEIESGGAALNYLTEAMKKAKASDTGRAVVRSTQKAAEKTIANQAKRTTGNDIKTTDQKRAERIANAAKAAARKAPPPTRPKRASTKPISSADELMAVTGLTIDQIKAIIAAKGG